MNVWDIDPAGKTDEQTAQEGLDAMEAWMNELGLVMNISDLGATEEMLEGIAGGRLSCRVDTRYWSMTRLLRY